MRTLVASPGRACDAEDSISAGTDARSGAPMSAAAGEARPSRAVGAAKANERNRAPNAECLRWRDGRGRATWVPTNTIR